MDARELRIGNYVRRKSTGEEFPVDIMNIAFIESDSKGQYEKSFEPISLTHEWLERLGFKKLKGLTNNEFYSLHTGFIEFQWECFNDGIVIVLDTDAITSINCIYLHQLQNLYYALTGKEIELKN